MPRSNTNPEVYLGVASNPESRLNEDRFRRLLEAAPDAILEVNAEGLITLVNEAAEHMFGYARDELIGQTIELLVPADKR
jgi:PAS domain S-box-containing protein